jgi:hypothetical protein
MRIGKLPVYSNNALVPTPDLASFDFIFRSSIDNLVYAKKSDGTVYQVGGGASGIKTYLANLSQAGTAAPTAVIGINTLGGDVILSRVSAGLFRLTTAGLFTLNKTFAMISPGNASGWDGGTTYNIVIVDVNTIEIETYADNSLSQSTIRVEVTP